MHKSREAIDQQQEAQMSRIAAVALALGYPYAFTSWLKDYVKEDPADGSFLVAGQRFYSLQDLYDYYDECSNESKP
jgi:hypothetical protein